MKKQKRLKAEMWDKMQYLFRNYYDRMAHTALFYDKPIDEAAFALTLLSIVEKAPVLHSRFVYHPIRPYWKVMDFTLEDIFYAEDTEDLQKSVDSFLLGQIPLKSHVQIKAAMFRQGERTAICFLINHMCLDGGDLKYLLKKLAENYNNYIQNGVPPTQIKSGSRSYEAVYTKLNADDEKVARKLYKNVSAVKDKHLFPLTPPNSTDSPMIVMRRVEKNVFDAFREVGKRYNATVNDMVLAVYFRTLYSFCDIDNNEAFSVPCMIDLRRHIEGGEKSGGLANHTGFMPCRISSKGETFADTLALVMESTAKSKSDKFIGLYSLPLLKLAYTIFPHFLSEIAIRIGYLNPLVGMSNVGVMPHEELKYGDASPVFAYITGAVKYKPYMQLAMCTFDGTAIFSIAIKGSDEDNRRVNAFLDLLLSNIQEVCETE